MPTFPFHKRPSASYRECPRSFGSPRDGGKRKHAGCDLYAPAGTEILAVEDGKVVAGPYLFYDVVYAIEVQHASGIVRYGEISHVAPGIQIGSAVKAGQVIAFVGKMKTVSQSMLHFELYRGDGHGPLTDRNHPPFSRRSDLIDPAPFLDSCLACSTQS